MMPSKSTPAGSVPYSRPPSPPRREAQNASATAAGALRTSSEPCRHSAMPSTTRRARVSSVAGSANWSLSSAHAGVEARVGAAAPARPRAGTPRASAASASARAARRGSSRCPSPPRSRRAAPRGRGAASPTPPRSRRRRGTRAPRTRGSARACSVQNLPTAVARRLNSCASLSSSPAVGVGVRFVVGAREAHRQRGRGLGLHAQVGEHVAHQRLVDQRLAEGAAVRGVVQSR